MADYDTLIIGAGHNGLVCAGYLAARGHRVLIAEASDTCGGLAARREFHPGYHATVAHAIDHMPRKIIDDLDLEHHGLSVSVEPPTRTGLNKNGDHVAIKGHRLTGVPRTDQDAYAEYTQLMTRFATLLSPFWLKTVPRIGNNSLPEIFSYAELGLKLRMLGRNDMREFLRMLTLPLHDLMDEYFEHPLLKAMLCWDGLAGSKQAPRSPNNSVMQLLYRMHRDSSAAIQSVDSLMKALRTAAESRGVEIRFNVPVSRINVDRSAMHLTATGVSLASGETISARNIVSSADPKTTFFRLLGVDHLEIEFANRIRRLRTAGLVAKLHLALNDLPAFTGIELPNGKLYVTPDMETIELAFDDAKYGNNPHAPVMEITLPSVLDASLTPQGGHLLSAQVMYVPYHSPGDESAKASLTNTIIDTIADYAPGIRKQIVGSELLTPADLEQQFHVTGGHWHHADFTLDQLLMMRPTYGAAQYRTPIDGLYLCGAGTHPAGDVTGSPGHNAAAEISR